MPLLAMWLFQFKSAGTLAEGAGWRWDKASGMVTPKQGRENKGVVPPTEEQLNRHTDFISYLENLCCNHSHLNSMYLILMKKKKKWCILWKLHSTQLV